MNLSGVRLVSWDVDGTLYSLAALKRALLADCVKRSWRGPGVWRELGRVRALLSAVEALRGQALPEEFAERYGATLALADAWLPRLLRGVRVRPEAARMLAECRAAGVTLVALSDFACTEKLHALGMHDTFAAHYACVELGAFKPAPGPFRFVQRAHGVDPEAHLHIGDRDDTDGAGARAAGARWLVLPS